MNSRRHFPCILALEFYLIVCAISIGYSLTRTGGHFVYPLDDTYISMDMGKNIAEHGVMGLTRHQFSFSSSCPLWIWMLAGGDLLAGSAWWVPLALGLMSGVLALMIAHRILRSFGRETIPATAGLLALCILTPLPTMALSGMEHALHIALVLWFVARACRFLAEDEPLAQFLKLLPVVALLVLVRYESLFLIGIFSLLLIARRRWLLAMVAGAAGFLPVAVLGWFSVSHGWMWLPNTLLLKGTLPSVSSLSGILHLLGMTSLSVLFNTPHLVALVAALLTVSIWRAARGDGFWSPGQLMIFFAIAGTFLHLQFAGVGWFYRYEAYLVALGIVALFVNRFDELLRESFFVRHRPPVQVAAAGLATLLVAAPIIGRGAEAIGAVPIASHNIFEQQYQMALFLNTYYPGASVAANDVGAINFLADIRCLDLVGLCDRQVLALKRRRAYNTQAMQARANAEGVQVAIVYDAWFPGAGGPRIPSTWTRVGTWHISDNAFAAQDTVSFYAVRPEETSRLTHCLREFSGKLPPEVSQKLSL